MLLDLAIYRDWLQRALSSYPDVEKRGVELQIQGFDVVTKMEYPDLDNFDVLMLTGSSESF
jgi:hypothetical protein